MKKTIKLMCSVLVLVGIVFLLAGCGKKGIVGSWKHEQGYVYTFKEDGTGNYSYGDAAMEFTYKVEDNKLSILYTGNTAPFETTFTIDGDTLTIKDSFDNDTIYKRQ